MPTLGPMVYRTAHVGAGLLVIGVVQFLLGMAVAQYLYPYTSYSLSGNPISDLGSPADTSHGLVFNVSVSILGATAFFAAMLIRSAFSSRGTARIGLASLAITGICAVLVGHYPENAPQLGGNIHALVAALAFFFSGLALVFLGVAMVRDTRWRRMRLYTFLSGLVVWGALALYATHHYAGLGPGGMERLTVAPVLLWGIVAGAHLLRIPRYRPTAPPAWDGSAGAS